MIEEKKEKITYLDDTSNEALKKELPTEVVCFVNLPDEDLVKENVPGSECFKKE